jgi:hypothetical protein
MRTALFGSFFFILSILLPTSSYAEYTLLNFNKGGFVILDDDNQSLIKISTLAFKPRWQWTHVEQLILSAENNYGIYRYKIDDGRINWKLKFTPNQKTVSINSELTSSQTIPLTYISLALIPDTGLQGGSVLLTNTSGETSHLPLPLKIKNTSNSQSIQFLDKQGQTKLTLNFSPAASMHIDGGVRIKLAEENIQDGVKYQQKITLTAPQAIRFFSQPNKLPAQFDHSTWFPFTPNNTAEKSQIGMHDWISNPKKPAKKIWGTNVEYIHVAPTKRNAKIRTNFFAKYGINGVRLHKLTNPGWEGLGSEDSASTYDPKKMARFDYWLYELSQSGITYGFSPIWDLKVMAGDKDRLVAYDEMVAVNPQKPVTSSLVWFAKDVQDLHIETLTNLLNHKNPHTQLRYADDPALNYIEIQNEDNAFFYTFFPKVRKHPTYHKLLAGQFSDWLSKKYRTHSNLVNAWGASAIDTFKNEGALPNEQLNARNISPILNPWFYDNQATKGYRAKRLQDTAEFLLFKQQEYYTRASKAIRETGFKGIIVNSNWQAGSKGAHFLNLLSDSTSGIIDRHNYQGGAKGTPGHTMKSGFTMNNYTMLGNPGSGLLSAGMQQVKDLPFMYSEWLAVVPSEWAAADTSIVAIYGFGLQGWDMSYHFASNGDRFSPQLSYPSDKKFNNLTPVGVGLYPILSRMVLRGDISEAAPIATRRLSQKQALQNQYDFKNTVTQEHDVKSVSGTPHHNALAAGKVLIEFTPEKSQSTIDDWKKDYLKINPDNSKTISSSTNELAWTYTEGTQKGFVEVNSKGTQGIIGFTNNQTYSFDDISITPKSPYSVILTTAKSLTETLSTDNEALIIAIARVHNTHMNIIGSLISNVGEAPMIVEPVKATMTFKRKGTIIVLDHDGIPTGKTYPLENGIFELDTERDKTIYYLVQFE